MKRPIRPLLAASLLTALAAVPAGADGWAGFYTPTERPDPPAAVSAAPGSPAGRRARPVVSADACLSAIMSAQARYDIPGNLLLAVGLQEAGLKRGGRLTVWPWTVNAAGDGRMFDTADRAKAWVRARQAAGVTSIDVGCMQVNLRWHPDAFTSLDQAFDPAANVDYAARFLRDLHARTGNWLKAAGSYHSLNDKARNRYLASLSRNIEVANARAPGLADRLGARVLTASAAAPPAAAPQPAAPEPQPGIGWWAALSGGADAPRVSIYSTHALQPVLPNFRQEF
ncbi:hypothetical protein U879_09350 [Defluviimonas sp. 20V17]|uniref:Transglycosylase SLT domain-containing protein n=1 Tax=Allgaiera indica TaxID=765699 RepID=A0AAN4UNP9_9RHOB|nr:lytic transglycosylase domain-containing protein [Allgaiera indica]KDB03966.1 hypothetical protein U879_09350 [Defluviimonas sp. 20V17]GHD99292.1 hypothetical protein GCM10008024_06090 [Allgaiera indica]SDW29465.1 Transglycosylase SLT domain-containing protein [Allgaiera indica]